MPSTDWPKTPGALTPLTEFETPTTPEFGPNDSPRTPTALLSSPIPNTPAVLEPVGSIVQVAATESPTTPIPFGPPCPSTPTEPEPLPEPRTPNSVPVTSTPRAMRVPL